MKRYLVLASVFLLLGTSQALAQVTYNVTTVPTFVINTGRAEVLGGIRITASNTGPTVASTIQYLYPGISCDNNASDGITLTVDAGSVFIPGTNVNIQSVTNTTAGCVVAVTVATGLTTVVGTSYLEIDGVRGRVDFLGGISIVGTNINGSLSATPSNSSLFTVPNTGVVGITAVGLVVLSTTPGVVLQCVGTGSNPVLVLQEGFNGAFVQHVISPNATAIPLNSRPVYGGLNNTRIHINVQSLPAGMTLTWPADVQSNLAAAFVAGTSGSRLEYDSVSTATDIVYDYVCGDQAVCDINTETFYFNTTTASTNANPWADAHIGLSDGTTVYGTATITVNLYPPLVSGDATSITTVPNTPSSAVAKPRFNDPPRGPYSFATNAPCRTDLLFPWVAFLSGSYDTGIAIANTSTDPFGAVGAGGTQVGTCQLNAYNEADVSAPVASTLIQYTTPSVPSGGTWANSLSGIPTLSSGTFLGYVIAVCNFQYGHGVAQITQALPSGDTIFGYVALIIPDPNIIGARNACYPGIGSALDGATGFPFGSSTVCVQQAGEGLSQ